MKIIRLKFYEILLNRILAIKNVGGGGYGRNIIMRWQEHMEFVKACRTYGDRRVLKSLFQDMGIKKIIILWNLRDNPFLWMMAISLMRRSGMRIGLTWDVIWKYKQKRGSLSTLYLYDKKGEPYDRATGEAFERKDPYDLKAVGSCLCIRQLVLLMNIGENYKKDRLCPVLENLPNYFQSIAVLGNNRLARYACNTLLKAGIKAEHIKMPSNLCYKQIVKQKADILLNMTFAPFEIKYQEETVYVMNLFSILAWTPETSSDRDIADQIIPQLQNKGIKVVVAALPCWPGRKMTQAEAVKDAVAKRKFLIAKGLLSQKDLLPFSKQFWLERKEMRYLYDKGYATLADQKGELFNVIHGMRYTCGNQDSATQRILMFGPCTLYGYHVTDKNTIASLIKESVGEIYNIDNHGGNFWNMNLQIRSESYHTGDIVIILIRDICEPYYRERRIPVLNLDACIDSVSKLENHFTDYLPHCDHVVNKKISETIVEYLRTNHILDSVASTDDDEVLSFGQISKKSNKYDANTGLKEWINGIRQYRCHTGRTGAIVMNCNPFTLGHRYLIETACKQVDRLLIFVVEEDKSFFKFNDRIEMVRLGTADLEKVTVIPSGKYIASAQTLPGYFEKNDNPDVVFDAADDLDLFAEVIAEELHISVRFAGEEPIDNYTRQYNLAMSRTLPQHGIEFVEIPRKEYGGKVISASSVRKLMQEKRYDEIRGLVLPQVYEYLETHYFQ